MNDVLDYMVIIIDSDGNIVSSVNKKIILDNSRIMEVDNFNLTKLNVGIRKYYEYIKQDIGKGV